MRSRNLFFRITVIFLKKYYYINNGPMSDLEKWLTSETLEATIRKRYSIVNN